MSVKSTAAVSSPWFFGTAVASANAFSIALPDQADAAALIGGASHVADAMLGPRD